MGDLLGDMFGPPKDQGFAPIFDADFDFNPNAPAPVSGGGGGGQGIQPPGGGGGGQGQPKSRPPPSPPQEEVVRKAPGDGIDRDELKRRIGGIGSQESGAMAKAHFALMSQWEKCRVALRDYPRLMFGTAVLISVALIAWYVGVLHVPRTEDIRGALFAPAVALDNLPAERFSSAEAASGDASQEVASVAVRASVRSEAGQDDSSDSSSAAAVKAVSREDADDAPVSNIGRARAERPSAVSRSAASAESEASAPDATSASSSESTVSNLALEGLAAELGNLRRMVKDGNQQLLSEVQALRREVKQLKQRPLDAGQGGPGSAAQPPVAQIAATSRFKVGAVVAEESAATEPAAPAPVVLPGLRRRSRPAPADTDAGSAAASADTPAASADSSAPASAAPSVGSVRSESRGRLPVAFSRRSRRAKAPQAQEDEMASSSAASASAAAGTDVLWDR